MLSDITSVLRGLITATDSPPSAAPKESNGFTRMFAGLLNREKSGDAVLESEMDSDEDRSDDFPDLSELLIAYEFGENTSQYGRPIKSLHPTDAENDSAIAPADDRQEVDLEIAPKGMVPAVNAVSTPSSDPVVTLPNTDDPSPTTLHRNWSPKNDSGNLLRTIPGPSRWNPNEHSASSQRPFEQPRLLPNAHDVEVLSNAAHPSVLESPRLPSHLDSSPSRLDNDRRSEQTPTLVRRSVDGIAATEQPKPGVDFDSVPTSSRPIRSDAPRPDRSGETAPVADNSDVAPEIDAQRLKVDAAGTVAQRQANPDATKRDTQEAKPSRPEFARDAAVNRVLFERSVSTGHRPIHGGLDSSDATPRARQQSPSLSEIQRGPATAITPEVDIPGDAAPSPVIERPIRRAPSLAQPPRSGADRYQESPIATSPDIVRLRDLEDAPTQRSAPTSREPARGDVHAGSVRTPENLGLRRAASVFHGMVQRPADTTAAIRDPATDKGVRVDMDRPLVVRDPAPDAVVSRSAADAVVKVLKIEDEKSFVVVRRNERPTIKDGSTRGQRTLLTATRFLHTRGWHSRQVSDGTHNSSPPSGNERSLQVKSPPPDVSVSETRNVAPTPTVESTDDQILVGRLRSNRLVSGSGSESRSTARAEPVSKLPLVEHRSNLQSVSVDSPESQSSSTPPATERRLVTNYIPRDKATSTPSHTLVPFRAQNAPGPRQPSISRMESDPQPVIADGLAEETTFVDDARVTERSRQTAGVTREPVANGQDAPAKTSNESFPVRRSPAPSGPKSVDRLTDRQAELVKTSDPDLHAQAQTATIPTPTDAEETATPRGYRESIQSQATVPDGPMTDRDKVDKALGKQQPITSSLPAAVPSKVTDGRVLTKDSVPFASSADDSTGRLVGEQPEREAPQLDGFGRNTAALSIVDEVDMDPVAAESTAGLMRDVASSIRDFLTDLDAHSRTVQVGGTASELVQQQVHKAGGRYPSALLRGRFQPPGGTLAQDQSADAWRSVQMRLDEGDGILTIRARTDSGVTHLSIEFTDPGIRAAVESHAERLREMLQTRYDTTVDLTFRHDGGGRDNLDQRPEDRKIRSEQATPGTHPGDERRDAVHMAPGSTNTWIG